MIFLNPTVLLGLLAAGIPILIHLLNLRKLKKIEFSTLVFLKELQKTKIRKIKLKQLILLALRILIILFLVLSFARPTLESVEISSSSSKAKTSSVYILDNSMSMTLINENGSNFNRSKEIVNSLISDMQEGDEAVIIQTAKPNNGASFVTNTNLLNTELDLIETSTAKNSLAETILEAVNLLANSDNLNKEIYIFSDLQENNFSEKLNFDQSDISEIRFYVFNSANSDKGNTAIEKLILNNQLIEKGKAISFSALISNSSQKNQISNISLFINGKRSAQKSFDLLLNESKAINFETTLKEDGFVTAKLVLEDDDLLLDNEFYLVFFVPKSINVLMVYDNPNDITFLELALQNEITKDKISLKKSLSTSIYSTLVNDADVIVYAGEDQKVADILNISKTKKTSILLFPPSNSNQSKYNSFLSKISSENTFTKIDLTQNKNSIQFDEIDFEHPIFSGLFIKEENPQINSPQISKYYKLSSRLNGNRIISLIDKTPIIYEITTEQMILLNFNIAPVISWSDLPIKGLFAPIIVRSIFYLSSHNSLTQSINTIESIPLTSDLFRSNIISIEKPNGEKDILPTDKIQNKNYYTYSNTDKLGVYKVYDNDKMVTAFSVNHSSEESILAWANEETFTNFVGEDKTQITFLNGNDNYKEKINQTRFGTELWRFFLMAALIAALLEMIISRNTKKDIAELS